ncbi:MAG: dNTP triphosphohydrolase [Phycisphaerae bacterium]|nr:dNTP triphosphohydrolase [Phycisphaerae bacterium]MCZ2401365.1 dNTP triphosphohydrolase [Phycisphaerae bacterium]
MVKADRFSREHPEPLAETLSPLELDRHRIVNAAAFRRLQYKTQVFVAPEEDHFRTRMTHTLEVAHLARLLAAALRLDFGLAEVVALAHDLGHPPFGHAGERALADCMAAHGGYEHNRHALRVVEHLEHPYPDFPGLNLTRVVRECLAKHTTRYDLPGPHPLQDGRPPPPEGQVAALADRLAYALHDLQDGVYAGVIEPAALDELAIWRRARQDAGHAAGAADPAPERQPDRAVAVRRRLRPIVDRIVLRLVRDAAESSSPARVSLSAACEHELAALGEFLQARLYRQERLMRMDSKGRRVLTAVFEAYVREPRLLPTRYYQRVAVQGAQRVACDYVAGMTDRFCQREHARLFDARMEP